MGVTLPQLRALVTVVDCASFTAAASRLGVSQSAVSHALSGLEREVGGRLVQRDAGASLTGLGHSVVEYARAALASVSALESAARRGSSVVGTVRLGAVATVCQGLLPDLLPAWAATLPHVDVQIFEGDDDEMPEWLEAGVVDAAILVEPLPFPAGGKLVATDEFAAVVRRDHPLTELDGIPLAELQVDGLIVSTGGCERHVQRMHDDEGLPYEISHRVREMSTVFRMVQQGMGVAIVPSLGRDMLPDDLVMKPLARPRPRRLVMSGPSTRPWHPLVRALVEAA
ncbi:LysR family transcriptional regulator [Microbacterium rhizosphaerae]|uniref:LysR family transcriptional regulator n=1 Tax=Microbacterium rhizosphaerae TaxID=1678237 RepID=A0ABZ0SIM6_9MICO|nr:LysR family transcriptional regulator [Microbacterium rhizosphaerae]WPR88423.1 LysR family transcriptional regulator [Microbacterium rhizosphaerae]